MGITVKLKKDGTPDKRSLIKNRSGGRKSKVDEQTLIERLSPLDDVAYEALGDALRNGEAWAVKLFMEYRNGKPHQSQTIDQKTTITIPTVDMSKWK
tara:strand:- start:1979 stop:2269 length:291 start_codon:yes stop_codon:yes gene_type:complete